MAIIQALSMQSILRTGQWKLITMISLQPTGVQSFLKIAKIKFKLMEEMFAPESEKGWIVLFLQSKIDTKAGFWLWWMVCSYQQSNRKVSRPDGGLKTQCNKIVNSEPPRAEKGLQA